MSDTEQGTRAQPNYLSYLLRMYRVDDGERPMWHLSLESSLAGEQMGFASLDELVEFLRQQMDLLAQVDRDKL